MLRQVVIVTGGAALQLLCNGNRKGDTRGACQVVMATGGPLARNGSRNMFWNRPGVGWATCIPNGNLGMLSVSASRIKSFTCPAIGLGWAFLRPKRELEHDVGTCAGVMRQ
jgi:hypothetical protein